MLILSCPEHIIFIAYKAYSYQYVSWQLLYSGQDKGDTWYDNIEGIGLEVVDW